VPAAKVRQLDWWQQAEIEGIRFVATPAQHFSGRGLFWTATGGCGRPG
jgi:L-ascorbate metabolism protein UlaG (beta-lactamase superfamily)